jgi:hypothetical protein
MKTYNSPSTAYAPTHGGYPGQHPADVTYVHTHVSARDGSPAMVVSQDATTITLVNEDGFRWTDPLADWHDLRGA